MPRANLFKKRTNRRNAIDERRAFQSVLPIGGTRSTSYSVRAGARFTNCVVVIKESLKTITLYYVIHLRVCGHLNLTSNLLRDANKWFGSLRRWRCTSSRSTPPDPPPARLVRGRSTQRRSVPSSREQVGLTNTDKPQSPTQSEIVRV